MPRVLTFLVLMLLVVVGGAATVGGLLYVNEKRKRLGSGGERKALPAGPGGALVERGLRDLRVGDVLTVDGKDFVVEGTINYDEDGHRWVAGRSVDGADVMWLMIGIERVGTALLRVLRQEADHEIAGYPPEVLVIGETRYTLDKRGTATCKMSGELGALGAAKDKRPENHVERCRWWLYGGAGEDTLVLEQWGGEYRVLRGKKVSPDTVDLIPGS
jgi:hypothetical protein